MTKHPPPISFPKHPRARGDDSNTIRVQASECGTPPREGGRPERPTTDFEFTRNTPAHGGTTGAETSPEIPEPKHPRERGDDALLHFQDQTAYETPPRTGGRRAYRKRLFGPMRNTPAHGGTTATLPPDSSPGSKHPRARGDDTSLSYSEFVKVLPKTGFALLGRSGTKGFRARPSLLAELPGPSRWYMTA